jgi:predicted nucleic acid-binding protein
VSILYDSSALVASCVAAHPQHRWVLKSIDQGGDTPRICAHALAETFAVLTGAYRLPAVIAIELVEAISEWAEVVELNASDYFAAMRLVERVNRSSGAIYDALHCVAAVKAKVSHIVTLNPGDFETLVSGVKIVQP